MKHYFGFDNCPNCNGQIDRIATRCPHCHEQLTQPAILHPRNAKEFYRFENYVQVSFIKEIILFFVGWLGFKIVGLVVSIIAYFYGAGVYEEQGFATLADWAGSPSASFIVNAASYIVLFVGIAFILWKSGWLEIGHSYKKYFSLLIGVGGLIATFGSNFLYGLLVEGIFAAIGRAVPTVNGNEQAIRDMIFTNIPLSYVVFGLIGPFVEEITYRVGLFSFFGRTKRWIAYVASAVLFGLIHFEWENLGTVDGLLAELIALPTYIGGGLILGFVYEKGGVSASLTSHMLNNLISITLTVTGVNG